MNDEERQKYYDGDSGLLADVPVDGATRVAMVETGELPADPEFGSLNKQNRPVVGLFVSKFIADDDESALTILAMDEHDSGEGQMITLRLSRTSALALADLLTKFAAF